jgi:hypothetical protein
MDPSTAAALLLDPKSFKNQSTNGKDGETFVFHSSVPARLNYHFGEPSFHRVVGRLVIPRLGSHSTLVQSRYHCKDCGKG